MSIITSKDYLIPLFNQLIRDGKKEFKVYEGWKRVEPIIKVGLDGRFFNITAQDQKSYNEHYVNNMEEVTHKELVLDIIKASGVYPVEELEPFKKMFSELTMNRNLVRGDRPIWFFYDTCAMMNNIPYVFRKMLPEVTKHSAHTTSIGVQNEIEEKFDLRFKNRETLERVREVYGTSMEDFYLQPFKIGRIARLAYPEIELMKKNLGRNIIENSEKGDTGILNAFHAEARSMNVEGIVVTCDKIMAERAGNRGMVAWYVEPNGKLPWEMRVKMNDLILMVYRAAIIYGKVRIGDDSVINGVWAKKQHDDWKEEKILIDSVLSNDLGKLGRLMIDLGYV